MNNDLDGENLKLRKKYLGNSEDTNIENKSLIIHIIYTIANNLTIRHLIKQFFFVTFLVYFMFTFNYSSFVFYNQYDEEYYKKDKLDLYLKPELIAKFNYYIKACQKSILLDKKKYPLSPHPKISILMPIYNGGKYLYYSLRSIQNQKLKDIEIIIVDDCSTDDSLTIVEKYMKEDPRIRLIKNNRNRRILFSKSFAALNSNGKFIMQLDQDDIFIREDAFNILLLEAENNNLDLVHIRDFVKPNFYFDRKTIVNTPDAHLIFPQMMHYKNQPNLKNKNFVERNNYLLWGLLIKSELYKKAIYHLWPIIINYQIIFHEDYTISFMLVILAKRYKYLNNFALIHLSHTNAASGNHLNEDEYYLGILFFANTFYDYYIKDNPEDVKILLNYIFLYTNGFKLGSFLFPNLFDYIIRNVFSVNNKYISDFDKEDLKIRFGINNNHYRIWDTYNYIMRPFEYKELVDFENSIYQINKFKYFYKQLPAISVIIFCNEFNYLNKTIISVEKQNYDNFEIIIIYDNIEETNLNLIKDYIKDFSNIKLIDNKKVKGILYSISTGILIANGEYILTLQSGVTLSKDNILIQLYNEIRNNDADILEFNLLLNNENIIINNSLTLYRCSHIKTKIDLKLIKYNQKYKGIDQNKELLFNKLIKASALKNIIKKYKFNEYNDIVYNYYDDLLLFALNKMRPKFRYMNIFGCIQYTPNIQELNVTNIFKDNNQKIKDIIFYINFLYDNTENKRNDKEFVLNEFFNILNILFNKFTPTSNEAIQLYNKFLNCEYIEELDKKDLEYYYNSLLN